MKTHIFLLRLLLPCLFIATAEAATVPTSSLVRSRFDVTFTTGTRQGESFSGTFIYDDSQQLDLFGTRPLRALTFTYRGKTYRLNHSPEIESSFGGFIPELRPTGSIDGQPVVFHGLQMFMADAQLDIGMNFISTTPAPGQFVNQSRMVYGSNVLLNGEFGGPEFMRDGRGIVTYQEVPIPEPSSAALSAMGAIAVLLSSKSWHLMRSRMETNGTS